MRPGTLVTLLVLLAAWAGVAAWIVTYAIAQRWAALAVGGVLS